MSKQMHLFQDDPDGTVNRVPVPFVETASLSLFADEENLHIANEVGNIPERLGKASISVLDRSQVLTPANGFMSDYDFTLNPYSGCQFACAYCYAAFFTRSQERQETWGHWVEVKSNGIREVAKRRVLKDKKIYMSSVTDPYQPLEGKIALTRRILQEMVSPERQPRLVIQTRSPLVRRDIDILREFTHLRVNMTVTTDNDAIRKHFEPSCPSNDRRLDAIAEIKAAGIKVGVCVTPMLPLEDPERFAIRLAAIGADIYVAQPFKSSNGRFAASTRSMALDIAREYDWTDEKYRAAFSALRAHLPHLYEGREGFMPE
jgi:DNA repair photolyase